MSELECVAPITPQKASPTKTVATDYDDSLDKGKEANLDCDLEKTGNMLYFDKGSNEEPTVTPSLFQKMLAEVMGTFILVFFGCGSVCVSVYTSAFVGLGQSTTIWTLGGALAIYTSGSVSGGHLNPAVSLAFAILRPKDFSLWHMMPYWMAQLAGAFLGAVTNYGIFHQAIAMYEEENGISRGDNSAMSAVGFGAYWSPYVSGSVMAFFIEMLGTAMLTFVIFSVTHKKNNVPAAAVPALVGIAIGSIIAIIGPMTGGAINPARDLGPRIVTAIAGWGKDSMKGVTVYMLGPLIGGPVGGMVSDMAVRNKRCY